MGLGSDAELSRSPFAGALFEGLVASEIVKAQANAGRRRELYFFRDHRGLEVDFVVPRGGALALAQDEHRIEVFRRADGWIGEARGAGEIVVIHGAAIAVDDVYR